MFIQSLFFILQSATDLLAGVFLLRFLMQWARVPFRNPLGQFVIAATDWAVLPTRKLLPGLWGLDISSVFLAWFTQVIYFALTAGLTGMAAGFDPALIGMLALVAVIECVRVFLYLVFGIVLITAIMSWVNPYAPLAPVLNALAKPFLAPLQRVIPPLGGVNLSPLVLIILLQLLLGLLASLRMSLFA